MNATCLALSPAGTLMAIGGDDGRVYIWNLNAKKLLGTLEGHGGAITSVTFTPDAAFVVSGSHDGSCRIWDPYRGKMLWMLEHGAPGPVRCVTVSADGQRLAFGAGSSILIWSTKTWVKLAVHRGTAAFLSLAFAPDGTCLASGSVDNTLRIWYGYGEPIPQEDEPPPNKDDPTQQLNQQLCISTQQL